MDKIVGGVQPPEDHPGKFNTVALVKATNKKVFCTGSLISRTMILTAKHCLVDKKAEDVLIFFGDDTNQSEQGHIKEVKALKVRRPKDWEMTFPSFDVAWIELKENAPDGFKPLPIISNKSELNNGPVHLAGHGNSSLINGKIDAGKKFITNTKLKNYYNNARFFHILLFQGEEGQGACHGDSGGPAYIKTKTGWAIAGVTNGFDIVLTPKAMSRTNDDDFPYRIDCKKNQILYSFAGAHGAWIERTSNNVVLKTSPFIEDQIEPLGKVKDIQSWCKKRNFGSPEWNFLKLLLDKKVDSMEQKKAEAFYNNCESIESYLRSLSEVRIDGEKTMDASYSMAPLHFLNIKTLKIFGISVNHFDFNSEYLINIENMILNNVTLLDLKSLSLSNLRISHLNLANNPLNTLEGLEQLNSLESLSLYRTKVEDFSPLYNLPMLTALDLAETSLKTTSLLKHFKLKELTIGGSDLQDFSLIGQTDLEFLTVTSIKLKDINFLLETPNLKELNLAFLGLKDLTVFSKFDFKYLERLNLTGNPIVDLSSVANLKELSYLRLFGTAIFKREVTKTPENCPLGGPEVLVKFCSNP